ncbi:sigma-70 family RNA polymerase sigma factor, partial [Pedobacter sp.]|uniref:sigma-70 family RNA polymerase sigma factor n=1 Tax=Pedobacter sp. TaxID=1411316 RepID=UPI003D7F57CA
LWKSRHRIEINNGFSTYIAAIVKYKVMARMAANHKKRSHFAPADVNELEVADYATENLLSFNDLRAEIEEVVTALPEKCQIVFRMSREQGLSDKQIAEELGVSQKTVEGHISRALKVLRNSIHTFMTLLAILLVYISLI